VQTGQTACNTLHAKRGPLPLTTAPRALYNALRNQPGKPATFPAAPTPDFREYFNQSWAIGCWYQGRCSGHPNRATGSRCVTESELRSEVQAALTSAGLTDWQVITHGVYTGRKPCATVALDSTSRIVTFFPEPR
jgi:hypothetical protein